MYKELFENKDNRIIEDETFVREILAVDFNGMPLYTNGILLAKAIETLEKLSTDLRDTLIYDRFIKDQDDRYEAFIRDNMKFISGGTFNIGRGDKIDSYVGERYYAPIILDDFFMSDTTITNYVYSKYNKKYSEYPAMYPATNVTWYDAYYFCKWVGCSLPSDAQWEYSCRGDSKYDWISEEDSLINYGWYSENSDGKVHSVGLLKENSYGLKDLHGNVWEWCIDSYDENYFANKSNSHNPVNLDNNIIKVCRGGSIHAFSEMCKITFRHNEPADYKAYDIGFRIAKNEVDKI